MEGLMQDWPLRVTTIIDHAVRAHPEQEIVTRTVEGPIHRYTYKDLHSRSKKAAKALLALGVKKGDRIATLAWNTYRHMETWYGIMGIGAICHTLNPRLFTEQLIYIINHAEDDYILTDLTFISILEEIADEIACVKGFIVLTDSEHMPETSLKNVMCYEELIEAQNDEFEWLEFDENTACGLCYTSGTTGNPKGVLYSHRSNVIHALASNSADGMGLKATDTVLPVVPMFHANAWGLVFSAPAVGAKIVMPGMRLDGESIYQLLEDEKVTSTAAVPTVWLMLLNYMEQTGLKLSTLQNVVIGGAACPEIIIEKFEKNYGVKVIHAWGMTEMSPLGTLNLAKSGMDEWSDERQMKHKLKQGRAVYTVEMKIVDDDNNELPNDGETFGHLMVRGPAVARVYFKDEGGDILDKDGWFDTGDVATLDPQGFMQITDRSKDVIKSGGEWISSIELENIAMSHSAVAEAAVIGVSHPKWTERPLLIVVPKDGKTLAKDDVLNFMTDKIAKWCLPDDVVFVDELPHTATGKVQKLLLREQFKDYQLPTVQAAE